MKLRARKVFRGAKPPSRLENRFETLWRAHGGPGLEREFRFHPTRRWRADFAHLPSRTLIEIEGGIYINGRHNRGAGFAADLENRSTQWLRRLSHIVPKHNHFLFDLQGDPRILRGVPA